MRVAITGTTGYLGSCLAAAFLAEGWEVLCLSRRDDGGARTRDAIAAARRGFGFGVESRGHLRQVPWDPRAGTHASLEGVDAVWHCAAHMSLSHRQLPSAHEVNVRGTCDLYRAMTRDGARGACFYHVSTAFIAGFGAGVARETLHHAPRLGSSYLITKWAAELALSDMASRDGAPPVALVRPTLVGGHSESGWYGGRPFGVYMYLRAFAMAKGLGFDRLRLDLSPDTLHDFLLIDDFVANALSLTSIGLSPGATPLHFTGTQVSTRTLVEISSRLLGLELCFGAPETTADWFLEALTEIAKPIAGAETVHFVSERLGEVLGSRLAQTPVTEACLERLLAMYFREVGREQSSAWSAPRVAAAVSRATLDRWPTRRVDPRPWLARSLVQRAVGGRRRA